MWQILGTAINNNGSDVTLSKPSGKLQQQCIRDAFLNAGREPREVDYVELHATGESLSTGLACCFLTSVPATLGTTVGDPIEANAAGEIFYRDEDLIVGSVKGNLGSVPLTFRPSLLIVYRPS